MNFDRFWYVMDYARTYWVHLEDDDDGSFDALEVGCDDGAFALGLSLIGYCVTALDPIRTPFISHLYDYRAAGFTRWAQETQEHPSAAEATEFHLIHLGEVIEHVKDPDALMHLARCRCLEYGCIIVSAPNFNSGGHLRTYNAKEFGDFVSRYIEIEDFQRFESHKKPGKYQWLAVGPPRKEMA